MRRELMAISTCILCVTSLSAQAEGFEDTARPYISAGFYDFEYARRHEKLSEEIFPRNYVGPILTIGIRPFELIAFEISYFSNGNAFRGSVGSGDYEIFAQTNMDFHVWTARAVGEILAIPWTNKSAYLSGILSVSTIHYAGSTTVGYNTPDGEKDKENIFLNVEGKKMGPGVGLGLNYHPAKSHFETVFLWTQYAYSKHMKSRLLELGVKYYF